MNLDKKIALVTGASSGIGKAIALSLATKGATVVFTYNSNKKGADEVLAAVGKKGMMVKVDMRNDNEIIELFTSIKKTYGKLDILVNNAGVNRPRDMFDPSVWKEVFQINLFSLVLCTGEAIKLMNDGGKILNISSVYGDGKSCWRGLPAYGASKAGVNHFTQSMAKNLAPKILVNAIAPGYVQTPLWGTKSEQEFIDSGKEQLIERMIQPNEIADIAVAVIQSEAMTGEVVTVDGGISLKTV